MHLFWRKEARRVVSILVSVRSIFCGTKWLYIQDLLIKAVLFLKKTINLIEKNYDLKGARFDRGLNTETVFKLHEYEGF